VKSLPAALLLLGAAGCRAAAPYPPPQTQAPATWSEPGSSAAEPEVAWWSAFRDPVLDALVQEAARTSLDVELARSRVREARALYRAAGGSLEPQLDFSAGYARASASRNTPQGAFAGEGDLWQAGFDASWELDFFGRNAAQVAAARAGLAEAQAGLEGARLVLLSELALNYVELRGDEVQLEVLRANSALQRDTLELTRSRQQAGLATGLDEARAETQLASTESFVPTLEAARRASLQRIALLLGRNPESIPEGLESPRPLPEAPPTPAAGTPAELLRRRPDVRAAEQTLERFLQLAHSAEADLYPRISLHATLGQQSSEFQSTLDGASRFWAIGPSIVLPLFDRGTLHALAEAADERARQALIGWQKTVLEAFVEVETSLTGIARERERQQMLVLALAAAERALEYANELQSRGLVDFFQVIDAQRTRLLADAELARSRTELAQKTIALYKALGGGWQALAD
jgi:NodT family efflux transporter outer membrane factor (OMF) lipoprotein